MKKLIMFIVISTFAKVECKSISETEIDAVVDRCCELGKQNSSNFCHHLIPPIEIPLDLHELCNLNLHLCCELNRQEKHCYEGKKLAKSNSNCNLSGYPEMSKICCNACKLGLQIAESGGKCNRLQLDCLVDQVKSECYDEVDSDEPCNNSADESSEEDCFDDDNHGCQHACIKRNCVQMCTCKDGYKLNDNGINCTKTDDYIETITCDGDDDGSDERCEERCDDNHECNHNCIIHEGEEVCECNEGYKLDQDGKTCNQAPGDEIDRNCTSGFEPNNEGACIDIDECAQKPSICKWNETCKNTNGSFECNARKCSFGYQLSEQTQACEDINECSGPNLCLIIQNCVNTKGSYYCEDKTCDDGYKINYLTGECDDINECFSNYSCGSNTKCVNLPGSYECECDEGFEKENFDDIECIDIDECETTTCGANSNCINTQGSYKCECENGFEMYFDECHDINECDRNPCGSYAECWNNEGSFECMCIAGFMKRFSEDNKCVDIDECLDKTHTCRDFEICTNQLGSYDCEIYCQIGFKLNNKTERCEDIDECKDSNPCTVSQICVNLEGSFKCHEKTCEDGFKLEFYSGKCVDIDECMQNPCDGNAICVNNAGGYECECKQGFKNDLWDENKCRDINECSEQPGICDHDCSNYNGGYRCSCRKGFQLSSDQRTCKLVRTCKTRRNRCQGSCKSVVGGHQCDCPNGFRTLGSKACVDINECKNIKNSCNDRGEFCLNTYGSSKCMKQTCDFGYKLNRVKRSCQLEDRSLCYSKFGCKMPADYGLSFGHVRSNCSIPASGRGLDHFTVDTNRYYEAQIDFVKVTKIGRNVKPAEKSDFSVEKSGRSVTVKIVKPIDGPQEVEINIKIHVLGNHFKDEEFFGQRMFIVVSGRAKKSIGKLVIESV